MVVNMCITERGNEKKQSEREQEGKGGGRQEGTEWREGGRREKGEEEVERKEERGEEEENGQERLHLP